MDEPGNWIFACRADEVDDDAATLVEAGDTEIAVCRVADSFYAVNNICTHEHACLTDGWVEGEEIECPLHQARFHIPTGRVLSPPATEDLKTYPVRRVDDELYVRLDVQ